MKKLLTTTAVLTVAMAGAASAQSVLERVLAQTASLNEVTGVFSNTADNIGATSAIEAGRVVDVAGDDVFISQDTWEEAQAAYDAVIALDTQDMYVAVTEGGVTTSYLNQATGETITVGEYNALPATAAARSTAAATAATAVLPGAMTYAQAVAGTAQIVAGDLTGGINGSINVVANQIDEATASVGADIQAVQSVTTNFGNFATTVLGAVNTGEIGLGTNQEVEEAVADTSQAVRSVVNQVGTTVGSTVLAMNSALNTMDINGSINVDLNGVNASVAAISPDQLNILSEAGSIEIAGLDQLLGNMATTVLGAVNTGTIVSGVDNQVAGTVAGIVGNSATNMFSQ
jgi:hypothetical protein